ncbi:MAG: P-loop containing nucleoside triphosphate hydrolase protein [Benniella sp.]|nr:MAG: P-loop containing nucleoside triphosphate hydrolase protein [Benniella sp.]
MFIVSSHPHTVDSRQEQAPRHSRTSRTAAASLESLSPSLSASTDKRQLRVYLTSRHSNQSTNHTINCNQLRPTALPRFQTSASDMELESPQPFSSVQGSKINSSKLASSSTVVDANLGLDSSTFSTRQSKEPPQWLSESAILVAGKVRPFSAAEQAQLPPTAPNRFNFSAEASLSGGFGSIHNRPVDDYDAPGTDGAKSSTGVRKVVGVMDERVLVFDPPDADSLLKYKKALLPVQAYRRFKDIRYAFDRVFSEDADQQEVFENTTRHLIDGVLNGYNGTLFAYGATGCGKTHTITGTTEKPGIIFLTMQELYDRIAEVEDEKTIEVSVSYLEVYNETIRDLLAKPSSNSKAPSLQLREDQSRRVTIAGLSEHHPKGMEELMEMVFKGNENRTVSPTEANATSSRSHAVLQINICQRLKTANVSEDFTVATLSLIDLAGSERASVTKNRGSRLMEGANINKSLLALGNCINALCENKPKSHIPYRDSKLTRLLKFSLGGNCKTVMIACVSPSSQHYEETHNTLKYANRAKNIKTKVTKNTLNVDRHVSEYVQAIFELREEVAGLKIKLKNQATGSGNEKAQQRQEMLGREFEEIVRKMRASFQAARSHESTYAQLQSQLFHTSARLSGLCRWRAGFDEASGAAKRQQEKLELEMKLRGGQEQSVDDSSAGTRIKSLNNALNASSSYIKMVDKLINDLNDQTHWLTNTMQEHEDQLKLHAVSIQSMEQKGNPILEAGFPYQRLYELEKKCQALDSHNKILTNKLELSDKALGEQFLATEDFMELSARSLVGLRPEIEMIEGAGMATKTLNDIYMAAITSFTDMTKRAGSSLPQGHPNWGPNVTLNDGTAAPSSPFRRDVASTLVGLNESKMMSILPEVPLTPVKRHTTHVLPNLSMETVDTKLALGSSSLFGSLSPARMYQERSQPGTPLKNPFQDLPTTLPSMTTTTARRRSNPIPGVLFPSKRKRVRGGLRQPQSTPRPAKRTVNFLLDIVSEDEHRYSTGLLDASQPPIRPIPFPSLSPPRKQVLTSSSMSTRSPFTPSIAGRTGLGGGAKRIVPNGNINGTLNGHNGARRILATNSSLGSNARTIRRESLKGAQRIVPVSNNSSGPSAASPTPGSSSSPLKRARQAESNHIERNGKRARTTITLPPPPPATLGQ